MLALWFINGSSSLEWIIVLIKRLNIFLSFMFHVEEVLLGITKIKVMLRYFFLASYHMLQSKSLERKKNDNDRIDLDMLFILILAIFLILFLLPFATILNVINTACPTCNHFLETSSFPVLNRLLYCFISIHR